MPEAGTGPQSAPRSRRKAGAVSVPSAAPGRTASRRGAPLDAAASRLGQDARMPRAMSRSFLARRAVAILIVLASCAAAGARAQGAAGVVRHVIDGDTLVLQPGSGAGEPIRLRLLGIDAPEICQSGGIEARDAMAQRVAGRSVQAIGRIEDDYHRRLVTITLDGEDINAWMVRQGHAWNARYRGKPGPYAREEREARDARRGVFAAPDPLPPRQFRRIHGSCYPPQAP